MFILNKKIYLKNKKKIFTEQDKVFVKSFIFFFKKYNYFLNRFATLNHSQAPISLKLHVTLHQNLPEVTVLVAQ